MLELEGHLEDRAFDDELLVIAQDLPGQQDLVLLVRENLDHALRLEDPTAAKQGAERNVHETELALLVKLRHEPGKSESEFPERLDVCPAPTRRSSRPPRPPKSDARDGPNFRRRKCAL